MIVPADLPHIHIYTDGSCLPARRADSSELWGWGRTVHDSGSAQPSDFVGPVRRSETQPFVYRC